MAAAALDGQAAGEEPNQLPFRVKVGGAVLHGVEKHADAADVLMADDFQLVHGRAPLSMALS